MKHIKQVKAVVNINSQEIYFQYKENKSKAIFYTNSLKLQGGFIALCNEFSIEETSEVVDGFRNDKTEFYTQHEAKKILVPSDLKDGFYRASVQKKFGVMQVPNLETLQEIPLDRWNDELNYFDEIQEYLGKDLEDDTISSNDF